MTEAEYQAAIRELSRVLTAECDAIVTDLIGTEMPLRLAKRRVRAMLARAASLGAANAAIISERQHRRSLKESVHAEHQRQFSE